MSIAEFGVLWCLFFLTYRVGRWHERHIAARSE